MVYDVVDGSGTTELVDVDVQRVLSELNDDGNHRDGVAAEFKERLGQRYGIRR